MMRNHLDVAGSKRIKLSTYRYVMQFSAMVAQSWHT